MSAAISIDDRAQLRRWAYSSAFVVGVHVAIAAAALSWRLAVDSPNRVSSPAAGPLMIDLAPPPAAPKPAQGGTTQTPIQLSKKIGAAESTVRAGGNAQPSPPPGLSAPAAPAATQPIAGQVDTQAKTSSGGGTAAQQSVPSNSLGRTPADAGSTIANTAGSAPPTILRVDPGPLDLSITVQPPQHRVEPIGVLALPAFGVVHPMERPGERNNHRNLPPLGAANARFHIPGVRIPGPFGRGVARVGDTAKGIRPEEGARNAIGNAIGSATPAGHGEETRRAGEVRNALGEPVVTGAGSISGASAANRTVVNAIGITVHVNLVKPDEIKPDQVKTDPIAATHMPPMAGIINGTSMGRAGTRVGVIGGPARSVFSGGINGNDFHPRPR